MKARENKIHINIEIEKWRNRFKCPFYWPRYASPTKTALLIVKSPTDAAGALKQRLRPLGHALPTM
jgi:hypothetical protein